MSNKSRFQWWVSMVVVAWVTCSCAESRFGERIQRDSEGRLPPLRIAPVSDDSAERAFAACENVHEEFRSKPEVQRRWTALRAALGAPGETTAVQRRRIGRLLEIAGRDRSNIRVPLVQLWAIRYGRLEGAEAERAEEVLIQNVIAETDLGATIYYIALTMLVIPPDLSGAPEMDRAATAEQLRAFLANMDRFFRTGRMPAEGPGQMPPASEDN